MHLRLKSFLKLFYLAPKCKSCLYLSTFVLAIFYYFGRTYILLLALIDKTTDKFWKNNDEHNRSMNKKHQMGKKIIWFFNFLSWFA